MDTALLGGVDVSQSYIVISVGDRMEFYNDDGTKTATVHLPSQNITALAYDEVHNMLLYVDKQNNNDAICGYNVTSVEHKCFTERKERNIQGLAFDPVTEILFFTDTNEKSINWFSFKPGSQNNVSGNLLIKLDEGIPTDIAVDGCRGYIYWINTNLPTSTIERARVNGSHREFVISATYKLDLHSLAIGQQTQKIYWNTPETSSKRHIYSADLNGKSKKSIIDWTNLPQSGFNLASIRPNSFAVSKNFLYAVNWCSSCNPRIVWKFPKFTIGIGNYTSLFQVPTGSLVGIATNYKMKDQFQGISDCSHVLSSYETNDSHEGSFCVHGIKLNEKSICKCTPGYIGVRCEVSVCENYCFQGNCSFTEQGLPECRCGAGYSGERCEVNMCNGYCLNSGTCFLNEEDQPFCECMGQYEGERCEAPVGQNNGDGLLNDGDSCQLFLDGKLIKISASPVPLVTIQQNEY